jgi:hypothetical protein
VSRRNTPKILGQPFATGHIFAIVYLGAVDFSFKFKKISIFVFILNLKFSNLPLSFMTKLSNEAKLVTRMKAY